MKKVLTGIQATGVHIGNWIGAIQPALDMVKDSGDLGFFFIADYHALNKVRDPQFLSQTTAEVAATWLALGLDYNKHIFYKQSDIPEIMEIAAILATVTPKGLLNRAHAYKALTAKNEEAGNADLDDGVNMGLYTYPLLMTADILAFNADKVPVGKDNAQHLEIARDIAGKFNHLYKTETFTLPELVVRKDGKLLPGMDGRKMSASYNNHIPVFLPEKKLRKMIMKITTDSTPPEEPKSTDSNSIFELYKEFATAEQVTALEKRYQEGIGWGEAKQELFEVLNAKLSGPRETYDYYMENRSELDVILKKGAKKARMITQAVLMDVKKAVGVL
jgi:tryptophanyl-tRNA synthetase